MKYVPVNKIKEIVSRIPRPYNQVDLTPVKLNGLLYVPSSGKKEADINAQLKDIDPSLLQRFKDELLSQLLGEVIEINNPPSLLDEEVTRFSREYNYGKNYGTRRDDGPYCEE